MGSGLLLLLGALAVVALYPVRRLALAGWPPGRLAGYWLGLVLLGLLVAEFRGPARFLVPLYVAVYVAPFVTLRAGIARLLGREPGPVVPPVPIRRVGPHDTGPDGPRDGEGDGVGTGR